MTTTTERAPAPAPPDTPELSAPPRIGEKVVLALLWLAAAVSIVVTLGIVFVLFSEATAFFTGRPLQAYLLAPFSGGLDAVPADQTTASFRAFFTQPAWRPFGNPANPAFQVGVMSLVHGTLLVTAIAMAVAVPLGLATAVYLSEYAPPRVRRTLKPILEVLAGVPTVVLGYFALTFMTPLLRAVFGIGTVQIFNAGSAGIVMGIMIVPTVASLSEDAMSAVPATLRQAAYGLGATQRQVATRVVMPAALSGIVAATILGLGRAIGETMIVAIAAGNLPIDFRSAGIGDVVNPFGQVQTMTAYIVQAVQGEAPRGSLTYESIFAVGALLFTMTLALNIVAQRFVRRFREAY